MKQILPHLNRSTWIAVASTVIALAIGLSISTWLYWQNQDLRQQSQAQQAGQQAALESVHQVQLQNKILEEQTTQIQTELTQLQAQPDTQATNKLESIYQQYQSVKIKIDRNNLVKLNTTPATDHFAAWGLLILDKDYDKLTEQLTSTTTDLDKSYQEYQASLPKATPAKTTTGGQANPTGYSSLTANTSRGNFAVKMIKLPLNQYTVKTVAAANTNCADNCPAKPLAQYVSENGAYAGIHGSYFCPPDYPSCAGKVNSFDFAFFNSTNGQWHNPGARSWTSTGMITFTGQTAQAHKVSANYTGFGVTAAISNFPPLILHNGQVNSDENSQTAVQKAKNYKGALGVNDTDIFLVIATGVSITDLATVMQSLGATHALNLDGGGSGALYIGGAYKVGPGRQLPNAIVLVKN